MNSSESTPPGRPASGRGPTLALASFAVAVPWMLGMPQKLPLPRLDELRPVERVLTAEDRDGDGLSDALEDELLLRHAPTLVMAADEPSRPVSIEWIRERVPMGRADAPKLLGVPLPGRKFDAETRRGSESPSDRALYGHAFPGRDGSIKLQYWYYFPYNDGPLFFDHESDWEHMTVELEADLRPRGVALARHEDNAPGVRYGWDEISREGNHPVVLVARGTHAAYARADEAPFWETLPACGSDENGRPDLLSCRAFVWHGGRGASRVVNVGERGTPRDEGGDFFLGYRGLWGAALLVGTAAPPGPPYQRGFCAGAAREGCP